MARQRSQGKCNLCNKAFAKAAMSRHLAKCLEEHAKAGKEVAKGKPKQAKSLHLLVEGRHNPEYWLHLEVPAGTKLTALDGFLRDIWLECCGHLSAFTIQGTRYAAVTADQFDDPWGDFDEQSMKVAVEEVLRPGMKFLHEYDYGSTTELALKVVGEHEGTAAKKGSIRLLARNDPPPIPCGYCGQPATLVNTEESWEPTGWVCDKCAEEREVDEEMCLPVVNSPRVGVCAYTGT